MTSDARAQRLVDEFTEGATWDGGFNVRQGIAWVLRHVADTEAGPYADSESFYAIARTLEDLADALVDALEAPSLLDRAMAGDAQAARQFLREAGYTDASGNWLPQYQSQETPMTWQSIDTAPRDGTTILGWDGQDMAVVRWSAGCLEAWELAVCGTYAIDGEWHPTHWQPLPDHPALPEETDD